MVPTGSTDRPSAPCPFRTWPRLCLILFFGSAAFLAGQQNPVPLASEIRDLERILENKGASGPARRAALIRLAGLLELSGNIEGAAGAWGEAAFAEPGKRDDTALVNGAECLIALGELDKAEAAVKTVLLTGRDRPALLKARYLGAYTEALRPGEGDIAALASFLDDPDYADLRSRTYYLLWKVSGNDTYRTRLISEYAGSPEGMIASNPDQERVGAAAAAMWILFPGRDSISLAAPASDPAGTPLPASSGGSPAPWGAATPPAPAAGPSSGPTALQIGLYSREQNARAMAERLRGKGFTPAVSGKQVDGNSYWAVTVPPGADSNRTILRLKDAGFEAFPVF